MSVTKIQDTFNDKLSKADLYWNNANLQRFYRTFRKPMILPKNYLQDVNSPERIEKIFQIRGFQFGNWVTTEDRFNYLACFYICLFDLNKILKFKKNNLGLSGSLGIALGSRGVPNALAHYEPKNVVINISRYKREDVLKKEFEAWGQIPPKTIPKEVRFIHTGGIGSFAHEYGHFLDGEFGMYTEPFKDVPFLTGRGGSLTKRRIKYPKNLVIRNLVEDLFETLFWEKAKTKKKTNFSLRLEKTKSDYLENRQEIFARTFEQYISYKMGKIQIKNLFMVKLKYNANHYLKLDELKKIEPILDKIVSLMRERT
jgi:hypothetical protein